MDRGYDRAVWQHLALRNLVAKTLTLDAHAPQYSEQSGHQMTVGIPVRELELELAAGRPTIHLSQMSTLCEGTAEPLNYGGGPFCRSGIGRTVGGECDLQVPGNFLVGPDLVGAGLSASWCQSGIELRHGLCGVSVVTRGLPAHMPKLLVVATVDGQPKLQQGRSHKQDEITNSTPVAVLGLTCVKSIALGKDHSCAVLTNGTARCWGHNNLGQLGNGTLNDSSVPVPVTGLQGIGSLALGSGHSCAALQGGGVYCWGWNNYGQLGNASAVNSSTRVAVASLASNVVTSLAAGDGHTCALLTGFSARCWGDNANGQLGTGTRTNSSTPVPVALGL